MLRIAPIRVKIRFDNTPVRSGINDFNMDLFGARVCLHAFKRPCGDHMPAFKEIGNQLRFHLEENIRRVVPVLVILQAKQDPVESILSSYKAEQQGYRACMALLKLSDQYSSERLEAACAKGLFYTPRPSYKSIQTILKAGQGKLVEEPEHLSNPSEHGFTRGSGYYGGRGRG